MENGEEIMKSAKFDNISCKIEKYPQGSYGCKTLRVNSSGRSEVLDWREFNTKKQALEYAKAYKNQVKVLKSISGKKKI